MTAGPLLFDFVRHWSRRSGPHEERGRLVALLTAVAALESRGAEPTVGVLADELGIDQSGTSRLVSEAVAGGCLESGPGREDARRRVARLTPDGVALLDSARQWQEEVFLELSAGWSQARREAFRAAMADLVEASYAYEDEGRVE